MGGVTHRWSRASHVFTDVQNAMPLAHASYGTTTTMCDPHARCALPSGGGHQNGVVGTPNQMYSGGTLLFACLPRAMEWHMHHIYSEWSRPLRAHRGGLLRHAILSASLGDFRRFPSLCPPAPHTREVAAVPLKWPTRLLVTFSASLRAPLAAAVPRASV